MSPAEMTKIQKFISTSGVKLPSPKPAPKFTEYDWNSPKHFTKYQIEKLQSILEESSTVIAKKFKKLYNMDFSITVSSIEQKFAQSLIDQDSGNKPNHYHFNLSEKNENDDSDSDCGLLYSTAKDSNSWVNMLLAETETQEKKLSEITDLEISLLRDTVNCFTEGLSSIDEQLNIKISQTKITPQIALDLDPTTELCIITYQVNPEIEGNGSQAIVILPCVFFDPVIFDNVQKAKTISPENQRQAITEYLKKTRADIEVRFDPCPFTIDEIANLGTGDIIVLDTNINDDLNVFVGGEQLFKAFPSQTSGRYSVTIKSFYSKDNN